MRVRVPPRRTPGGIGRVTGLALVAAAALAAPRIGAGPAAAQEDCQWLAPSGDLVWQGQLARIDDPHLLCAGGVRVRADSARYYELREYYDLFGNVLYEDADRILRSGQAQYFRADGRLQAQEDVRLTRRSDNMLITGENLVYGPPRGSPGGGPQILVVTGGRPHAVLHLSADTASSEAAPAGETPEPSAPLEVDADRIEFEGEQRMEASGTVEITRDSLEGYADRAVYEAAGGRLTLLSRARMVDAGFTLEGDTIDALLPDDVIQEIFSRSRAVLTGDELDVRAPRIRMLMAGGALSRLVAAGVAEGDAPVTADVTMAPDEPEQPEDVSGAPLPPVTDAADLQAEHPGRPVARAQDFVIVADSLDVELPGEVLRRLIAVGDAYGESAAADSLEVEGLPEVARRDWIDGRTIEAWFTPVATDPALEPPDDVAPEQETGEPEGAGDPGGGSYRLERLTAGGAAHSLYRLAARDSATARDGEGRLRPAVHYVVGDTITLTLDQGEVRDMDVVGQVRGVHWEPVGRGGEAASARRPRGTERTEPRRGRR